MSHTADVKYSKQFVCIKNTDATPSLAQSFSINFSNSAFTNLQSSHEQTKTYLTPQFFCVDWFFNNVSEALKNNHFTIAQAAGVPGNHYQSAVYLIPDDVYDGVSLAYALAHQIITPQPPPAPPVVTYGGILNDVPLNGGNAGTWVSGNTALNWVATFDAISGRLNLQYFIPDPVPPVTIPVSTTTALTLNFAPIYNTIQYNCNRIFGNIGTAASPYTATIGQSQIIYFGSLVDLAPYQAIRLHSNIAKRTLVMRPRTIVDNAGNSTTTAGALSNSDILMEIPTYNQSVGGMLTFVPTNPDVYKQEIVSNFDTMTIELRDSDGNLLPLFAGAEFNFTFVIEREIIQPTNEDRVKSTADYAQFSTM
jgi:hypothetical protein